MHFCDTNVTVTIRLCPESFSVCLGSSCVRLMGRIFFGLLGSCALAWAVKEVPDSEAGPPAAELPRHTDIDPFAQGEARKARAQSLRCQCRFAGVRLHPNPLAIRRVGSMVDRSIRRKESGEEAPTMRVDAIMARQALGVAWLSSREKDSNRQRWNPVRVLQVQSCWRSTANHGSSELAA